MEGSCSRGPSPPPPKIAKFAKFANFIAPRLRPAPAPRRGALAEAARAGGAVDAGARRGLDRLQVDGAERSLGWE